MNQAELGDVAPGQIILKEMMTHAVPHFQSAIEEAKREITSGQYAESTQGLVVADRLAKC